MAGAARAADLPGDSVTSLLRMIGAGTGLFDDNVDGGLGIVMSALSGVAAALAVAILFSVYFRSGYRSPRDLVKHGIAATLVAALTAFVVYDMDVAFAQARAGDAHELRLAVEVAEVACTDIAHDD